MHEFLFIASNIMLPVIIIVSIGYVLQIRLVLDRATLTKVMVNYIIPGFVFMTLYQSDMDFNLLFYVLLLLFVFSIVSFIVAQILSKIFGVGKEHGAMFTNAHLFYNAGNYGVPVNDLAFRGDPFAMSIQIMLVFYQNLIAYSYGIFALSAERVGKGKALLGYFKMPIFYGLLFGFIFNYFQIPLPEGVTSALSYIQKSMIGFVLFILGAQIAGIHFKNVRKSAIIASFSKLILIPLIGLFLLLLFQIDGVVAKVILITIAMPSSVNSSVIASHYSNDSEYAAEIVMISTLFSAITIPLVIYVATTVF